MDILFFYPSGAVTKARKSFVPSLLFLFLLRRCFVTLAFSALCFIYLTWQSFIPIVCVSILQQPNNALFRNNTIGWMWIWMVVLEYLHSRHAFNIFLFIKHCEYWIWPQSATQKPFSLTITAQLLANNMF